MMGRRFEQVTEWVVAVMAAAVTVAAVTRTHESWKRIKCLNKFKTNKQIEHINELKWVAVVANLH